VNEYGAYLKQLPEVAQARKEMADLYRLTRKQNRLVGALLYKRIKTAEKAMIKAFYSADPTADQNSGLAALLSGR
jgi:hypothetical protein